MSAICPECLQAKHPNCDGSALDEASDEITTCACFDSGHDFDPNTLAVYRLVEASGRIGATLPEIQSATKVIGLTYIRRLLAQDLLVRLSEARGGWVVYVVPGDVNGRQWADSDSDRSKE